MAVFRLSDLPPPPPRKTGWPWTVESSVLPERMSEGREWPRISVVTPSFNQDRFLEATIRSVLLQGYPNLEYLVLDGGSTDESPKILRKYADFLTYCVSQRDGGPEFAINDGWERATGEFVAFLPSDDYFEPSVLHKSAEALATEPLASFVYGVCRVLNENDKQIWVDDPHGPFEMSRLLGSFYFYAPTILIRQSFLTITGNMDTSLRFLSDWDLWLRLALCSPPVYASHVVASVHSWAGSKTNPEIEARRPSYIPFERALVLRRLLKKRLFPEEISGQVRKMIACHYLDWAHALMQRRQWWVIPQAYVRAALWDPASSIGVFYRDCTQTARRAIRFALRHLKR